MEVDSRCLRTKHGSLTRQYCLHGSARVLVHSESSPSASASAALTLRTPPMREDQGKGSARMRAESAGVTLLVAAMTSSSAAQHRQRTITVPSGKDAWQGMAPPLKDAALRLTPEACGGDGGYQFAARLASISRLIIKCRTSEYINGNHPQLRRGTTASQCPVTGFSVAQRARALRANANNM